MSRPQAESNTNRDNNSFAAPFAFRHQSLDRTDYCAFAPSTIASLVQVENTWSGIQSISAPGVCFPSWKEGRSADETKQLRRDDSAKPEEERRVSRQMFPGLEWTAMGLSGYGAVRRTHWPADGVTPRLPGASTELRRQAFSHRPRSDSHAQHSPRFCFPTLTCLSLAPLWSWRVKVSNCPIHRQRP
jgi:hypothetical protein